MPGIHTVVLSGGVGARMGAGKPKQFLPLAGRPVLLHSLDLFAALEPDRSIVLVCPANYIEETRILLAETSYRMRVELVAGGADRHGSTLAGLEAVLDHAGDQADDLVLIHDAARPLIERKEVERLIQAFADDSDLQLASLAAPISETIVEAGALPGPLSRTADRSRFFAVKTPQAARAAVLRRMRDRDSTAAAARRPAYTDLLTWGEAHGIQGGLVPAGPRNHKLTHPDDLPWFESLLRAGAHDQSE